MGHLRGLKVFIITFLIPHGVPSYHHSLQKCKHRDIIVSIFLRLSQAEQYFKYFIGSIMGRTEAADIGRISG